MMKKGLFISIEAVSYTHLDVYKRQGKSGYSILRRYGEAVRLEATDFTLSRKAASETVGARTVKMCIRDSGCRAAG